ncbi:MAG: VCBS repeat-containing protein [Synechococcales bacterium]|nr:VCBS repeat-containing protein [Synechococcales bacterium]
METGLAPFNAPPGLSDRPAFNSWNGLEPKITPLSFSNCAAISGNITPISVTTRGEFVTGNHEVAKISGNGQSVIFLSDANFDDLAQPFEKPQLYLRNLATGDLRLVSDRNAAYEAIDRHFDISRDGQHIAFASINNTTSKMHLYQRLPSDPNGSVLIGLPHGTKPVLTDSSQFLAYQNTGDPALLHLYDRFESTHLPIAYLIHPEGSSELETLMSRDGNYIAFFGSPPGKSHPGIWLYDRIAAQYTQLSYFAGIQNPISLDGMSADGRYVFYTVSQFDRGTGKTHLYRKRYDRLRDTQDSWLADHLDSFGSNPIQISGNNRYLITRVLDASGNSQSVVIDGETGQLNPDFPALGVPISLSDDGRSIVFRSDRNLVPADQNGQPDLYLYTLGRNTSQPPNPWDWNQDGTTDFLWQNRTTGQLKIWSDPPRSFDPGVAPSIGDREMVLPLMVSDPNWQVEGMRDFDRDGDLDLLWRNRLNSHVAFWEMNQTTLAQDHLTGFPIPGGANWLIEGIGDFDRDGDEDLLWRDRLTSEVIIWRMNGMTWDPTPTPASPYPGDPNWLIEGIGDFNQDGSLDICWRYALTSQVVIWYMNGMVFVSDQTPPSPNPTTPTGRSSAFGISIAMGT